MPARGTQGIRFSRVRFDNPAIFITPYACLHAYEAGETIRHVKYSQRMTVPFSSTMMYGIDPVLKDDNVNEMPIEVPLNVGTAIYYPTGRIHSFNLDFKVKVVDAGFNGTVQLYGDDSAIQYATTSVTGGLDYVQKSFTVPVGGGSSNTKREKCKLGVNAGGASTIMIKEIQMLGWDECLFPGASGPGWT